MKFQPLGKLPDLQPRVQPFRKQLLPLRLVHLPPVGGVLRLVKGKIVPGVKRLAQHAALLVHFHRLRDEIPLLAAALANLHTNSRTSRLEKQEGTLSIQNRVGILLFFHPENARVSEVFPVGFRKSVFRKFMLHHLIVCHNHREAVRRDIPAFHIILHDLMRRTIEDSVVPQARRV